MCKMLVVVNQLRLGNRILGYSAWSGKEVMEFTEKQLKDMIRSRKQKVCGLILGAKGELELDKDGFFTTDMTIHTHIGNWKSMNEESMVNNLYVCIGSSKEQEKTVYHCISSRFEQAVFSESDMKAYLKIGIVCSGAKLDGENIMVASTILEEPKVQETVKVLQQENKQANEPIVKAERVEQQAEKVVEAIRKEIKAVTNTSATKTEAGKKK